MSAIVVENLTKSYGALQAVKGVSFTVDQGEVFGMLGPNGAGKSTTVEIIEGLRNADSGTVQVLGKDIRSAPREIKDQIGVALQTATLMPHLNPAELIELFGSFYSSSKSPNELLDLVGLQEKRNAPVQSLSGGQQQRLSVALALVNHPKIVFLDEPTTGLDPQARRSLWEVIENLKAQGTTIFLTTHYMEEAERLCDRIAIMDHGAILAMDAPDKLIAQYFDERTVQFPLPPDCTPEEFRTINAVQGSVLDGDDVVLSTSDVRATLSSLLDVAHQRDLDLGEIRLKRPTLEDVFIHLTGRSMRE